MGRRHEAIGIKQQIRFEWMHKTANLRLAGLNAKTIRQELHDCLANLKGDGSRGDRGTTSRTQVVNMLMKIWVSSDSEVKDFGDVLLTFLQRNPKMCLAVYWGMISVTYPFWFHVARHTGRLLSLQNKVTQAQVLARLKEQYGDRETVIRSARRTIRSFIAWGTLKESETNGCYEKVDPVIITDAHLASLMFEAALLAVPDAKGTLKLLRNDPAFYPFQLPTVPGESVAKYSDRIDVDRYDFNDDLLKLKV